ncbi:hypothetical protein KK141_22855, partial [Dyella sp. LX-66]|uniref:hypothetical protein n=1 Tax=Dyella sp. LX-66 TaxID=2838832 RepID=UPI001BE088AA
KYGHAACLILALGVPTHDANAHAVSPAITASHEAAHVYIMRNCGRLRRAAGMLRAFLRSLLHGTQECHGNA